MLRCCFALLLSLAFAAVAPAQKQELGNRVRSLNERLRQPSRRLVSERAAALRQLMESDPALALSVALPSETVSTLKTILPESSSDLEVQGEWEGPAEATVDDDFEHGTSRTRWQIRVGGERVDVFFASDTPEPRCGQSVKVKGIRLGNRIAAASATIQPNAIQPNAPLSFCTSTGQQNVAVLMVSFPSTPLPASLSASLLQNGFFGPGRSLDSYWREASYGKTSATGSVFGPFVLDADYSCDNTDALRTAAIKAADSTVDFRNYTRIFIIVPNTGTCSVGSGLIGCTIYSSPSKGIFNASTAVLRADYLSANDAVVSTASHEGGHNLGLNHASTLDYGSVVLGPLGAAGVRDEYGDVFSAMGVSYNAGGGNFAIGHYAAPHKSLLGWLSAANQQIVQSSGTFFLQPYGTASSGLQTIKARRGTGNNEWLWLEYRQPVGTYDPTLGLFSSQPFSGALIHYDDPGNAALRGYTQLLDFNPITTPNNFKVAALTAGESWADPFSDLSISINSATASGLSVNVSYAAGCAISLAAGGIAGSVNVTAPAGCAWTATSNASWITITSGISGSGNGTVTYSLTPNSSGTARTGTISVGGQSFGITQPGSCSYAISPVGQSIPISGGSATVNVTASIGCSWSAVSNAGWITISSASSGTGSGMVTIAVAPDPGGDRSGTAIIAGQTFTVTQSASLRPTAVFHDIFNGMRLTSFGSPILQDAGGIFASDPAMAQNPNGDTMAVERDFYNGLWLNTFSASAQAWTGWIFAGGIFQGTPAITVAPNGTAYLAARDSYGAFYLNSYLGGFSGWMPLGGVFATDPAIAAAPDGSVYLIARDNWGGMWSGRYIPGFGFQGWVLGNGVAAGKPSVVAGSDNALYIATRDTFNNIWMGRVLGNTWGTWQPGGGVMIADPQIAASGGVIYVTALSPGGFVWYNRFTEGAGNDWLGWTATGGALQSVGAAAIGSKLYLAGRDGGANIWWYDAGAGSWTSIGYAGLVTGTVAAGPR